MLEVNPLAVPQAARSSEEAYRRVQRETALKELEQLFTRMLLREMRKTVPENALFGEGAAQQLQRDLLDEAIAKNWAESGQLGLVKQLGQQLDLKMQSGAALKYESGPPSERPSYSASA